MTTTDPTDHDFLPVAGHPDDDECTHRRDGTDDTYCGRQESDHNVAAADPTTAQPATPGLNLDEIEAILAHPLQNRPWRDIVRSLVAEVRRLRTELVNEQAAHAKTCVNFDDFAEGTEGTAGQLRDARRQVETWRGRALGAEALLHTMGARRDAEGAWQPPPTELDAAPAAPRTYALPAEPPEGAQLCDERGVWWVRDCALWYETTGVMSRTWPELLRAGPLSSVPPAGTEAQ